MEALRNLAVTRRMWLFAFALALTGCVAPDETADPSTAPTSTESSAPSPIAKVVEEPEDDVSTTSTTQPPPPTIVLPENTPETADALAELVNIPSSHFPSSYALDDVDDDEPFCVNVEAPDVARTPLGRSERRAQGSHLVSISTYVYEDDETAIDSLEYARSMFERCDEAYVDDTPGEEVLAYHREVDSTDTPDSLDELISVDSSFSNTAETRFVYGDVGRSGSIVFIAATTDAELLPQLTQRISDRIDGLAGEGSLLVPRGTQDVGPGLGQASYWSWADGPAELRETNFATAEAVAFVGDAEDARLDQLAGSACASVWTYTADQDINALALAQFTEGERDAHGSNITEVASAAMELYCPGFHEFYLAQLNTDG